MRENIKALNRVKTIAVQFIWSFPIYKGNIKTSVKMLASHADALRARHAFLPHERLLNEATTSVRRRLGFVLKKPISIRVKWGWQACTAPTVRDICTFAVLFWFSVSRPLFASNLFLKGTWCYVVRRNFSRKEPFDCAMAIFLEVARLHDFRCYLSLWVWHLCNLPCALCVLWLAHFYCEIY
jgi:hypothetical protein